MVQVLSEIKDLILTTQEIQLLEGLSYTSPPNFIISPFNWNTFLHNISLGGLQNCPFFQNEIGTFNPDGTINTTINQSLMYYYNSSQQYAHTNLHP